MNFMPDGFTLNWLCTVYDHNWGTCTDVTVFCDTTHTSAELEADLASCLHDTMFSKEIEVCPFNPTGHLPHRDSSFHCGLSHLWRKQSHGATWQCQSLNSVWACFPLSAVVALCVHLTGFHPNGSSTGFLVCKELVFILYTRWLEQA